MSPSGVFLDTVGLVALWNRSDQWHQDADRVFRELIAGPVELFTTSLVLFECANTAARRTFRGDVVTLWHLMDADGRLVRPTEKEIASAWDEFERGGAASPAVVDLISFQVMRRLGLARAFTNDRHFRAAGFETLIR